MMDGEVDENVMLEYVLFHISPTKNSYEALACNKGIIEKVTGGNLDQLAACLLEAKRHQFNEVDASFKLQLAVDEKGLSWFTKGTLERFLHIVNTPKALNDGYTIMGEIAQLEETRKFHISLYAKDQNQDQSSALEADINGMKDVGLNQQLKVETLSSDATKNELLRALDLRLLTLEEELAASFDRATGVTCFIKHISDISAFIEYFGSTDLRNLGSKLLACSSKNKPCNLKSSQNMKGSTNNLAPQAIPKSNNSLASPAKMAQIERESSSDSDVSADSNKEDHLHSDRSRSVTRSATPRRSASPMRRIQIGRSGSRRSTPITIKSLNYFPGRERISCHRDNTDERNSGNEDGDEKQTSKPENTVRRMSVQDAISLFEHKQKDQKPDIQKISASSTNTAKSVLRRWSAGMGDSFAQTSHVSSSDSVSASQITSEETNIKEESKIESSISESSTHQVESTDTETKVEEVNERVIASAEWNRQKEAELNQMLIKMMETKTVKKQTRSSNNSAKGAASEQRSSFYSEYRKKRDEKLRTENLDKRTVKEAQIKVINENLEVSKLKMISKNVRAISKEESSSVTHKPRRNSAPPVLPKKDVLRPTNTKKASPKAAPLPATRKSWSQIPSPKSSGNAAPRTPGVVSTSSASTNRRKPILTPSPASTTTSKIKKSTPPIIKPNLNSRQENPQKSTSKSNTSPNTKKPSKPVHDSRIMTTKPSFYNKVTKKSSIVPLESKPVTKKCSGLSSKPKTKVSQHEESANNCEHILQPMANPHREVDAEVGQPTNADATHEVPLNNTEIKHDGCIEYKENKVEVVELSIPEIQEDINGIGISSPAWVEVSSEVKSANCDITLPSLSLSPEIITEAPLSSPKVRHSLSQMLKADNNEPEIIEWGNAENPPALVYQKDAPKGFKRLLKFARKNKGESNMSGFSSPSVFSEGDDDGEEPKANSKRSSDLLLRKAALQARGYDLPKSLLTSSSDGGSSCKWSVDNQGANDKLTAQSSSTSTSTILERLREEQNSSSSSNKATRSFFSLSTFRSNK